MAKLQRYDSQAPIPVEKPVYADPGAFRYSNAPAKGLSQLGQGLVNISNVQAELKKQRQVLADSLSSQKINGILRTSEIEIETMMLKTPVDKWEEESRKIREKAINKSYEIEMSDDARALKMQQINSWDTEQSAVITRNTISAQVEASKVENLVNVQDAYASGNIKEIEAADIEWNITSQILYPSKEIADLHYNNEKAKGLERFKDKKINELKPFIETALGSDFDVKNAINLIDTQTAELERAGILDGAEAADARQDLVNWAEDTANERRKQKKSNILQTYEDFAVKAANGELNADELVLSDIPEKELEEIWQPIISGYYLENPEFPTYDGTKNTIKTVTDYGIGLVSKRSAIISLMNDRYVNRIIDDDTFKYAVGRIQESYPKHVSETLQSATSLVESNLYNQGVGFLGKDWLDRDEKTKAQRVNMNLVNWMESVKTETKKYPESEQIYMKVRELGVMIEAPKIKKEVVKRPVPKNTESIYITTDEAYDALDSGVEFYDGVTGVWRIKP